MEVKSPVAIKGSKMVGVIVDVVGCSYYGVRVAAHAGHVSRIVCHSSVLYPWIVRDRAARMYYDWLMSDVHDDTNYQYSTMAGEPIELSDREVGTVRLVNLAGDERGVLALATASSKHTSSSIPFLIRYDPDHFTPN